LEFLISLTKDLKLRSEEDRRRILTDYDHFVEWIDAVPQQGRRQFRHMLRYFAFPDLVERMSSNNDRISILAEFNVASKAETHSWSDRQLDEALQALRSKLQTDKPDSIIDFYSPELKPQWSEERKVKTPTGEVTVFIPTDATDEEDDLSPGASTSGMRESIRIQAMLAEIGARMRFKIWVPRSDRARVISEMSEADRSSLLSELPLNYERNTLDTIEAIDVLWLKGRAIVRAFEVEHTTAVYSGLLRMADLLALQPNMDIRLHIVAPEDRKDKVFREMRRPVFSLWDRKPLSQSCTFLSYDSVRLIRALEHLSDTNESVVGKFEEVVRAEV
jgi:hypothetical protein